MDIFVGNFPFDITEVQLTDVFAAHGKVDRVNIITDRDTGKTRGFAFVTMPNKDEAEAAIKALNGADHGGRPLRVSPARPREDRR